MSENSSLSSNVAESLSSLIHNEADSFVASKVDALGTKLEKFVKDSPLGKILPEAFKVTSALREAGALYFVIVISILSILWGVADYEYLIKISLVLANVIFAGWIKKIKERALTIAEQASKEKDSQILSLEKRESTLKDMNARKEEKVADLESIRDKLQKEIDRLVDKITGLVTTSK